MKDYLYVYTHQTWSATDYAFCVNEGLDFMINDSADPYAEQPGVDLFLFHTKEDYAKYVDYKMKDLQ